MKYIKNVSFRLKDSEQVARLDALAYYYSIPAQEVLDLALEEYYLKKEKEDPKLKSVKDLHLEKRNNEEER